MNTRIWLLALVALAVLLSGAAPAGAAAPYQGYDYNIYEYAVPAPAAYLPSHAVTGLDLGTGPLLEPADMVVDEQGHMYILDSGNKRIIQTDARWRLIRIIDGFDNNGAADTFNNPQGLFVTGDGRIYVADTDNRRVVMLAPDGSLLGILANPQSELFKSDFEFVPLKLTVDVADRVYIVAKGVFEGIMQFDDKGVFIGFVGTNKVSPNPIDYMWKLLSTEAQRAKMVLFIPTEFSNLDIDSRGFVFATNIDLNSREPIKRLNPSGDDILKRYGYHEVRGDVRYMRFGVNGGPSKLIDIKYRQDGMYSALDGLRGRIFTYDSEGNLLYVFGANGGQLGTFKTPVAIEAVGDAIAVLDRGRGRIVLFEPTKYGRLVDSATRMHYNGNDADAVASWREVLRLNANYDLAYIGIGKAMLLERRNKEAMEYFKLGANRKYYSTAFKRYRKEVLKEHFGTVLSGIVLLGAALIVYRTVKKRKLKGVAAQ